MTAFQGLGATTLIGSMPHRDRDKAIALILRCSPRIPVWPQLPAHAAEQMMTQYIEGLPGLREEKGRTFVRADGAEADREIYAFYEEYLEVEAGSAAIEASRFAMGPETGATFRYFLEILSVVDVPFRALKGQVTGPFTLLAGLKDQDGRALLFDERFQDILPKLIAFKAKWQIGFLKEFGVPVIVFLDEPGLAGFGSSAFITVSAELVTRIFTEVTAAIHSAGALAGIHVCANTDWLLAFGSGFDIINFDSYGYFDKFALYEKELAEFIGRGGNIAWGVVPTLDSDSIASETPESLFARWNAQARRLVSEKIPAGRIRSQSLFTPSCGCGSLPEPAAEKVLDLLKEFEAIAAKTM